MIAIVAIPRVLWWFLVGWMCSGGFARIGFAVFRRTPGREYFAGEWAILRAPFASVEGLAAPGDEGAGAAASEAMDRQG